jgi:hypothetical protein
VLEFRAFVSLKRRNCHVSLTHDFFRRLLVQVSRKDAPVFNAKKGQSYLRRNFTISRVPAETGAKK